MLHSSSIWCPGEDLNLTGLPPLAPEASVSEFHHLGKSTNHTQGSITLSNKMAKNISSSMLSLWIIAITSRDCCLKGEPLSWKEIVNQTQGLTAKGIKDLRRIMALVLEGYVERKSFDGFKYLRVPAFAITLRSSSGIFGSNITSG